MLKKIGIGLLLSAIVTALVAAANGAAPPATRWFQDKFQKKDTGSYNYFVLYNPLKHSPLSNTFSVSKYHGHTVFLPKMRKNEADVWLYNKGPALTVGGRISVEFAVNPQINNAMAVGLFLSPSKTSCANGISFAVQHSWAVPNHPYSWTDHSGKLDGAQSGFSTMVITEPVTGTYVATVSGGGLTGSLRIKAAFGKAYFGLMQFSNNDIGGQAETNLSYGKQPAGPTKGSSALRSGNRVNVCGYGAKGDGTTDDTSAFQLALATGGRVVYVPPGVYLLGPQAIAVPEGTRIVGAGASTIIRAAKGTRTLLELGSNSAVEDLQIHGRGLKQGSANGAGVLVIAQARHVSISHVAFRDADRVCIQTNHANGVTVADCRFNRIGMAMNAEFSNDLRISNNQVLDARIHGFEIWGNWNWKHKGVKEVVITGNIVQNGGDGAIWATGTDDIVMADNVVNGAKDVGLDLEWCSNGVITGNSVSNCRNAGISLFYSCRGITIAGNSVFNNRTISPAAAKAKWWVRAGIWLTYPNSTVFTGDSGNRDITIADNTISCAAGDRRAVWIGSGSQNVTLNGNTIDGGGVWYGGLQGVLPMVLKPIRKANIVINQPFDHTVSTGKEKKAKGDHL
jgi:parallel beta-helix repeat protein